jgi:hypothetical protein
MAQSDTVEIAEAIPRDLWPTILETKGCFKIVHSLALTARWFACYIANHKQKIADFYKRVSVCEDFMESKLPNGVKHGDFDDIDHRCKCTPDCHECNNYHLISGTYSCGILDDLYIDSTYHRLENRLVSQTAKMYNKGVNSDIIVTHCDESNLILATRCTRILILIDLQWPRAYSPTIKEILVRSNNSMEKIDISQWPVNCEFKDLFAWIFKKIDELEQ